jgi:U3 small nucleolar RNA-associated protein 25
VASAPPLPLPDEPKARGNGRGAKRVHAVDYNVEQDEAPKRSAVGATAAVEPEAPSAYSKLLGSLSGKKPAALAALLEGLSDNEDEDDAVERQEASDGVQSTDLAEDVEAFDNGLVVELSKDELLQKQAALGPEYEIVEVGEDDDDGESNDGSEGDGEASSAAEEGDASAGERDASEEEQGEETKSTQADELLKCSEAYAKHYELVVDSSDAAFASVVETEAARKKTTYATQTSPSFGTLHVFDVPSSKLCEMPVKMDVRLQGALVRPRLKVPRVEHEDGTLYLDLTPTQAELFHACNSYRDVFLPLRRLDTGDELRDAWVLHIANHILAARTRVLRHNAKLREASESKTTKAKGKEQSKDSTRSKGEKPQESDSDDSADEEHEYRDQGFTRPRILVVLPYRSSAYKFVACLAKILLGEDAAHGKGAKSIRNFSRCVSVCVCVCVCVFLSG